MNKKIEELRKLKKELKLTYMDISTKSGLPLSTVQKVLGGTIASPRERTLIAIEDALNEGTLVSNGSKHPEISTGNQDFAAIIQNGYFYIDKSSFIKKWWESADVVTLITRPRRFGKTLNLSMLDYFFSNRHENSEDLFKNLSIWNDEKYRIMRGQYPVLFISFASVKGTDYETSRGQIIQEIVRLYSNNTHLMDNEHITDNDRKFWDMVTYDMNDAVAAGSIKFLCEMMSKYYGKKVLIFLDEYDTPIQEAYSDGFWDKMTGFIRNLFNSSFKTNQYLERAIMRIYFF